MLLRLNGQRTSMPSTRSAGGNTDNRGDRHGRQDELASAGPTANAA
jgi:hypothetical protein